MAFVNQQSQSPSITPVKFDRLPNSLTTDRLTLKCICPGDGAGIAQAISETEPALRQWLPWVNERLSAADGEEFVRRSQRDSQLGKEFRYVLRKGKESAVLGEISLLAPRPPRFPNVELEYWLSKRALGRGYMTEAIRHVEILVRDYLQVERIDIRCSVRNQASVRVAERCGYTLERTISSELTSYGQRPSAAHIYTHSLGNQLTSNCLSDSSLKLGTDIQSEQFTRPEE